MNVVKAISTAIFRNVVKAGNCTRRKDENFSNSGITCFYHVNTVLWSWINVTSVHFYRKKVLEIKFSAETNRKVYYNLSLANPKITTT